MCFVRVVMTTRKTRKRKSARTSMTDPTRTLVVGLMQAPPYDQMFEQSRRVYSPSNDTPPRSMPRPFSVRCLGHSMSARHYEHVQHTIILIEYDKQAFLFQIFPIFIMLERFFDFPAAVLCVFPFYRMVMSAPSEFFSLYL